MSSLLGRAIVISNFFLEYIDYPTQIVVEDQQDESRLKNESVRYYTTKRQSDSTSVESSAGCRHRRCLSSYPLDPPFKENQNQKWEEDQ